MKPTETGIRTKRVYDPPDPSDGLRLLVMRYWPRGISKSRADEWDRRLAPSPNLLKAFRSGALTWEEYVTRYWDEVDPQGEAVRALVQRARTQTVTLLCSCEDESRCHRGLLRDVVQRALKEDPAPQRP